MKLELNEQQLNIILQSLSKQPFDVVVDIITDIQSQYKKSKEKPQEDDTN